MTKQQLEVVNQELLRACIESLRRFQQLSVTENADVRIQLTEAITRANTNPDRWFLLDRPAAVIEDPFKEFEQ